MDAYQGSGTDPVTLHKYLYSGNNPTTNIDPSGYSFLSLTFNAINVARTFIYVSTAALGLYSALAVLPSLDDRQDVYLNFDAMNTGRFSKDKIIENIIARMNKDFNSWGVKVKKGKGRLQDREIVFGGEAGLIVTVGGLYDSGEIFGSAYYLWGRVYTDTIVNYFFADTMWTLKDKKVSVDSSLVGESIGKTGSHELAHMYGWRGHVEGNYIMGRTDPLDPPTSWSPQVSNHLDKVFNK